MKTVHLSKGEQVTLFNAIAIETSALCNRTCVFCPNHSTTRPDELMPETLITKMTAELRELRYDGRLTNYMYNEPTRDPRCLRLLRYWRQELPKARLMVSTNGDYLKRKEDLVALLDAGVRQLQINIYSATDGCGNRSRTARGIEAARKRHAQIQAWVDSLPGVSQRHSVHSSIPRSVTAVRIEAKYGITADAKKIAVFELQNRSGNVPWFQPAVRQPLAKPCTRPFRMLNINWRGDALLCCNDYHGAVKVGNVAQHTLVELWNSPTMNKYRLALQARDRKLPLCDECDYSGGHYPHMVDTLVP